MSEVELLRLFLRGAGASLVALELIILVRRERHSLAGRLAVMFALSIGAYLLCPVINTIYGTPLFLLCFTVAGWFWLFALAWFDDDFRLRWWHGAVIVALLALYIWRHVFPDYLLPMVHKDAHPALHIASRVASLSLIFWAVLAAWRGRQGDLVESRRRYRVWFIAIVSLHMVFVVAAEMSYLAQSVVQVADLINLIMIVLELLLILGASLQLEAGFFPPRRLPEKQQPREGAAARPEASTDPLEGAIRTAMDSDKVWLEPGLTIAGLAGKVGAPEYRVRQTINRRMGQRNFPQFVNAYRIAEAKRRLRDPAMARLPILTIALDVGFNSLGPFNRAFRAETAMSPAEWRAGADPDESRPVGNTG